jgi:hypothetical protein
MVSNILDQATGGENDHGVEHGSKHHPPCSFLDAEERRPYAQTLTNIANGIFFSMEDNGSAISNRDMAELMARDRAFGKGPAQNGGMVIRPPQKAVEEMKPLVVIPESHVGITPPSVYTPLPSKDHFRLLEILPGSEDASIQCLLHVCSMPDNRGAYEAVSYTWKTGWEESGWLRTGLKPKHPLIECNGQEIAVGTNLFTALRRLRREDSARVVWADALCIDQSNAHERSQQVAAMGDIFRNARGVLVWLGEDEDADKIPDTAARASSKAFAGVCSVVSTWAATAGGKHIMLMEQPQYHIQGSGTRSGSVADGLLSAESTTWLEVLRLYDRRWFRRLWVVQEIALARRATAIWGACEMPWEWIGLAAAIIRTNWNRIVPGWTPAGSFGYFKPYSHESRRLVPEGVMNAYFMYRISSLQSCFDPLRFSFGELLTLTRQFKCEDDRDKIFGLLGLPTTDHVNAQLTPDYSQTLADVYRSVASAMLCSTQSLSFLSHVHHEDIYKSWLFEVRPVPHTDDPLLRLPSWIPKWNLIGPQTLTPLQPHPSFAAGLSKPAQFHLHPQSTPKDTANLNPSQLTVRGILLSTILSTKTPGSLRPWAPWTQKGDVAPLLAQHNHTRHTLEKLAVTLSAGKSWYGLPQDQGRALSDFAQCLVAGLLWWALEEDAFGSAVAGGMPGEGQDKDGNGSGREGWSLSRGERNGKTGSSSSWSSSLPVSIDGGVVTMQELRDMAVGGNENLFLDAASTACIGRRLFRTVEGMRGVGPSDTRAGDRVCVIYGTAVPFVVRECKEKGGYTLVGECYIDDIMHGEAVDDARYEETWINLV